MLISGGIVFNMRSYLSRNFHFLYVGLYSFCASFYFFRSNLGIQLGPVDDHEIVRFIGSDKQLWIWQIPEVLLNQTEVGQYGENPRFRPAYYTLRLLETSAYGIDSTSWYFARILMASLTCFFLTVGLLALLSFRNKLVDISFSSWFILTILSLSAWQGILPRLGPAEIYLVLGISVFFYLATFLLINPNSTRAWVAACLTILLIVGSKENGILLLIPYVFLGCYVYFLTIRKSLFYWSFICTLLISLISAFGWILGVKSAGANVYGDSIGKQFLLDQLSQHLRNTSNSREFMFSFMVILIHVYANIFANRTVSKTFYFILCSQITISLALLGELIFYPQGFSELRYAVVTQLLSKIAVGLSVILLLNTIRESKISEPIVSFAVIFAFSYMLLNSTYSNSLISKAAFESVANQASGNKWLSQLEQIQEDLSDKPYDIVIIQMNGVWDYEPAYAMSQYLNFYGEGLPRYLHLMPFPAGPGLETTLLNQLNVIAQNGDATWMIEPSNSMNMSAKKYCITFNDAQIDQAMCDN